MAKVINPLFSDDVRGTVGGLVTFRRGKSGAHVMKARKKSDKPKGERPIIRTCFANAKWAHSDLPIQEWYEDGKLQRRRVPTWPEFWLQWLIDHPECLINDPDPESIYSEDMTNLKPGTYGAPVSGMYILGLWAWDYPDWRAADPNPSALFHSIDIHINGELSESGITLDQPDGWAEHHFWMDTGDILTTTINNAGELLDNIGYDIYGPDWTYYDSDGWNNDTSERETASGFDGTEISTPGIPVGWFSNTAQWQSRQSSTAGGSSPELVYFGTGILITPNRVRSPLINAIDRFELVLKYRQRIRVQADPSFILWTVISFDGVKWGAVKKLSPTEDVPSEEVEVDLYLLNNKEFHIGFSVTGDATKLEEWALDNIEIFGVE